jgi:transcriptional regulator with XRE-family HTH domain
MPAKHSSIASSHVADTHGVPLDHDKIRRIRIRLDITQEEASRRAGLKSRARWNDVESGRKTNLTISALEAIAAALGVKARDLLK